MLGLHRTKIRHDEIALVFHDDEFKGTLGKGVHWRFDLLRKTRHEVVSQRSPSLSHRKLDEIVASGALKGRAVTLDLKDWQRGLVWIDGRFSHVLPPGLYAYWNTLRDVRVEVADARRVRFEHDDLGVIMRSPMADRALDVRTIDPGQAGVLFIDGRYVGALAPGRYAFWKDAGDVELTHVNMRESMIDIAGQDVMTSDKVTLRLNAVVAWRVSDAKRSVDVAGNVHQSIYREAQLALRAAVGARSLDDFLSEKDAVGKELVEGLRRRTASLGVEVACAGVRDIILPGDMKDLMNKVTEAKKAAEAHLIARREETAAVRSQANTAKLLDGNPTLMRLRELEALEKIAPGAKLNIVLGENGLADRVLNLM